MTAKQFVVERISIQSEKSFEDVLLGLDKGIGRPNLKELHGRMISSPSFPDFEKLIRGVAGGAGLIEFLRLDHGAQIRRDPAVRGYKMVRILAGNPLIMKKMAAHVPHAGSYAPVTILVFDSSNGVQLCYDTMESYLAPYGNEAALEIAKELDGKVLKLLSEAAG